VFCNQKVEKLSNSMGFVVDCKRSSQKIFFLGDDIYPRYAYGVAVKGES
jgi:hypothetical protein